MSVSSPFTQLSHSSSSSSSSSPSRSSSSSSSSPLHRIVAFPFPPSLPSPFPLNVVSNTRYDWYSFLPLQFSSQFRYSMNRYFLLIAILQLFPVITPVSPITTWIPLLVIFSLTAIKDAVDDIKRRREDEKFNNKMVVRIKNPLESGRGNGHLSHNHSTFSSWIRKIFGKKKLNTQAEGNFHHQNNNYNNNSNRNNIFPDHEEDEEVKNNLHLVSLKGEKKGNHKNNNINKLKSDEDEEEDNKMSSSSPSSPSSPSSLIPPTFPYPSLCEIVPSSSLRVGDLLLLKNDSEIVADCVALYSSSKNGKIFLQTSNVDGENNFKERNTAIKENKIHENFHQNMKIRIECPNPNKEIYQFDATLQMQNSSSSSPPSSTTIPLTSSHLLLQSTFLRSTPWVLSCVVYGGKETKISQNKIPPIHKMTQLDKKIDRAIRMVFFFQLTLVILLGIIGTVDLYHDEYSHWYLMIPNKGEGVNGAAIESTIPFFIIPLRFLLLASMMIPISLKVSLDAAKLIYSAFVEWDNKLHQTKVMNTAIGEELGAIDIICSDKTGTLTCNELKLAKIIPVDEKSNQRNPNKSNESKSKSISSASPSPISFQSFDVRQIEDSQSIRTKLTNDNSLKSSFSSSSSPSSFFSSMSFLLRVFTLCNGVTLQDDDGEEYSSPSPDEICFVNFAKTMGFSICYRDESNIHIKVPIIMESSLALSSTTSPSSLSNNFNNNFSIEKYRIKMVGEFSSARKRQSIMVQRVMEGNEFDNDNHNGIDNDKKRNDDNGMTEYFNRHVIFLMKGADDVILSRCSLSSDVEKSLRFHSNSISSEGLRTFLFSYQMVPLEVFSQWEMNFHSAATQITLRTAAIEKFFDSIETQFTPLSLVGIEDKIQRGVPRTIDTLREGGIPLWVVTGDKVKTAIEIARQCQILTTQPIAIVEGKGKDGSGNGYEDMMAELSQMQRAMVDSSTPFGLVIDGEAVNIIFSSHQTDIDGKEPESSFSPSPSSPSPLHSLFVSLSLSPLCSFCLICRVTPLQKSLIVSYLQHHQKCVLAIGDGGNDVSMIQQSNVGIGIRGKEGNSAARASDYSIRHFRDLSRLLFVHGHHSSLRTSFLTVYCIYKSMLIGMIQLTFAFYSDFSGSSLFDSTELVSYNLLYTSLIGLLILIERRVSNATLMRHPKLYSLCRSHYYFNDFTLIGWISRLLFHLMVIMVIAFNGQYGWTAIKMGNSHDHSTISFITFTHVVFIQLITPLVEMTTITWIHWAVMIGSFAIFMIFNAIWGTLPLVGLTGVFASLLGDSQFYLRILLCCFCCLAPIVAIKTYKNFYGFHAEDILSVQSAREKMEILDFIHFQKEIQRRKSTKSKENRIKNNPKKNHLESVVSQSHMSVALKMAQHSDEKSINRQMEENISDHSNSNEENDNDNEIHLQMEMHGDEKNPHGDRGGKGKGKGRDSHVSAVWNYQSEDEGNEDDDGEDDDDNTEMHGEGEEEQSESSGKEGKTKTKTKGKGKGKSYDKIRKSNKKNETENSSSPISSSANRFLHHHFQSPISSSSSSLQIANSNRWNSLTPTPTPTEIRFGISNENDLMENDEENHQNDGTQLRLSPSPSKLLKSKSRPRNSPESEAESDGESQSHRSSDSFLLGDEAQ